jgi:GT2 family glycosyltransferase
MQPDVSIIIPTFNRRDRLHRLLLALNDQAPTSPAFEALVVVDGATDGTLEMLRDLRTSFALRVFEQANQGPAAARNYGLAEARGTIVLFMDDDVVPVAGLIERHVRIHKRDPRAVVIGPMVPPPELKMTPWVRWEADRLQRQYDAMVAGDWPPTARQFYTGDASLPREHALAVGGFDETFTRAEDVEFAYRLADHGLRFYFESEAAVLHDPGRPFAAWLRVPYEYGRFDVIMALHGNRTWLLDVARHEWKERHPLNRVLPRLCVGSTWRSRLVLGALGLIVRFPLPRTLQRFQMALCSPLFSVQYWNGISHTAGLGTDPWHDSRPELSQVAA